MFEGIGNITQERHIGCYRCRAQKYAFRGKRCSNIFDFGE